MAKPLVVGILMDPVENVIVGHDTTFCLMLELARRGHALWVFEQKHLSYAGDRVIARAREVDVRRDPDDPFTVLREEDVPLAALDAVLLRKDPPVDVDFLHATQMVDLAGVGGRGPFLMNEPRALRDANEKLFALRFPDLVPSTIVTAERDLLLAFLDDLGGDMVVKPIDGFAGRGVLHLRRGDRNLHSMIELATVHGREPVIAQRYLPESREGDKRIIVLDGEPIGALLRIPAEDDVRGNLAVGGSFARTTLTTRDREICEALVPDLRVRGLHLVGLDVIGRHLTEINVTSPTGVEEINRVENAAIERRVIDFVEERARP